MNLYSEFVHVEELVVEEWLVSAVMR